MIMIRCDENLYLYIKNCTNNALIEVKGFFAQKKRFKIDISFGGSRFIKLHQKQMQVKWISVQQQCTHAH